MRRVRWCFKCDVPLLGEKCNICGNRGRDCAKDLKPIFDKERKLLEKFLGIRIPSFAFRYRNRIIVGGRTFLTFRIDAENERLVPIRYPKIKKWENDYDLREKVRDWIKANEDILKEKERTTIEFIKNLSEKFSQMIVLFGGGKDSAVTAVLAKKALGNIPLLFIDTTLEFPETYRFVEKFARLYGFDLIKNECGEFYKAEQDFFELCKRLGPPSIYYRWCCHVFKEQPVRHFLRDLGNSDIAFLTGIRKRESKRRKNYLPIEPGRKITKQTLVQPIIDWMDIEIWLYTIWRGIEVNELYKLGHARVGCWPCPCTPPLMDLMRRLTHFKLWKKFERVLLAYARANSRSEKWVKKGLWRLRRPRRKKIFINPLEIREDEERFLFTYRLPYRESLLERCKVLGDVKVHGKAFIVSRLNLFKMKGKFQDRFVELNIECSKSSYLHTKRVVERFLSRVLNCIGCGACISSCPKGALKVIGGTVKVSETCDSCGVCLKGSCTIEDSEKLFVVKFDPFFMSPCGEGLPMNHIIFPTKEIGKIVARKLCDRGVRVEVHEGGRIVCVDANFPRWRIERIVASSLSTNR